MWDDPRVARNPAGTHKLFDEDPSLHVRHCNARLELLNDLYGEVRKMHEAESRELEAKAALIWMFDQFQAHVPPEVAERVLVESKVNEIDPDFSFRAAIGPK